MRGKRPILGWLAWAMMMVIGVGPDAATGSDGEVQTDVVVFAAASTTNAVTEIGKRYADRNQGRITTSFASSSTLAKQIQNGAPADVYLSANKKWMDFLEARHLIDRDSRRDLLGNRIVLIAPLDSTLDPVTVAPGFSAAALLGRDRLAPMKDVRAALVLVERAEAPLGLVYATDAAISRKVRVVGTFPADSHPPIVYPVAAVAGGKSAAAQRFIDFLGSPESRAIFEKYGFVVQ